MAVWMPVYTGWFPWYLLQTHMVPRGWIIFFYDDFTFHLVSPSGQNVIFHKITTKLTFTSEHGYLTWNESEKVPSHHLICCLLSGCNFSSVWVTTVTKIKKQEEKKATVQVPSVHAVYRPDEGLWCGPDLSLNNLAGMSEEEQRLVMVGDCHCHCHCL